MDEKRKFHELLEALRERRGISKKELAMRTGLSTGYISLLTRGVRETPSEIAVKLLADSLHLDQDLRAQFFSSAGYPDYRIQPIDEHTSSISPEPLPEKQPGTKKDYAEASDIRTFLGVKKSLIYSKNGL